MEIEFISNNFGEKPKTIKIDKLSFVLDTSGLKLTASTKDPKVDGELKAILNIIDLKSDFSEKSD